MNPTQAVLLAAGTGSRLMPLTEGTPKCLLPVAGKSFLERAVEALQSVGVRKFIVVTGHLHEQIRDELDRKFPDLEIVYVHNPHYRTTNTGYSCWLGLRSLEGSCYLLDADVVFAPQLLQKMADDASSNLLLVDTDKRRLNSEAMKVDVNDRREVVCLDKNMPLDRACGEFTGIAKLSDEWRIQLLKKMDDLFSHQQESSLYYEDVMNQVCKETAPIHMLPTAPHAWFEVDTPENYKKVQQMWA